MANLVVDQIAGELCGTPDAFDLLSGFSYRKLWSAWTLMRQLAVRRGLRHSTSPSIAIHSIVA